MRKDYQELNACFTQQGFTLDYQISPTGAKNDGVDEVLRQYQENRAKWLFHFGFGKSVADYSPPIAFLHQVSAGFIQSLSQNAEIEFTRENTYITPSEEETEKLLSAVPFALGTQYINKEWINYIYQTLSSVFAEEISAYPGSVAEFLLEKNAELHVAGRVFFHLVENKSEEYPFAFLATYSTQNAGNSNTEHVPLKNALLEYKDQNETLLRLLSTVSKAAQKSGFISEMVEKGELFHPLRFTSREAYIFLREIPLYEECGILCRIPDWWRKKHNTLKLSVKIGGKEPSKVGMDALLNFDAQLLLGGETLTEEEIKLLLAQTDGLSLIKGKWVEVDHRKLQSTLEAYEKAKKLSEKGVYTMAEAMRMQLGTDDLLGIQDAGVNVEVTHGEWLQGVMKKLRESTSIESVSAGDGFLASLRTYQQTGLNWLNYMKTLGFGACLADDMGLGKTVQIIALLEHLRQTSPKSSLLIIPASLLGNWRKEIDRFAPQLNYQMIYSGKEMPDMTNPPDLVITTYGMAARMEELKEIQWNLVILDEAQAIKNPGTKQTKAVKQIKADARIAMTGTPIENSLSDLWSLFDFLNVGLLGTAKEFKTYIGRLKEGGADYAGLRAAVGPFILRRLKTDKTVITDLPEKIEMKEYASLTKKQVVLYNGLVREMEYKLETAEGIERKGMVLAGIMKFKQICNHPDQFLGQAVYRQDYSGKFGRLADLCETIREKRERVLVFTQFREMTGPLARFLETVFGREGLVLHGGTPVKKRAELVERFSAEEYVPFMVLSLKAGGVGLNLTAANHVIHFDRWWNPAVENQATDRAFRIGQDKNVMVHKLVTTGTIEEKIDMMIEEKSRLAGDVIASSGESWITEMSNQQLMELFTLTQAGE